MYTAYTSEEVDCMLWILDQTVPNATWMYYDLNEKLLIKDREGFLAHYLANITDSPLIDFKLKAISRLVQGQLSITLESYADERDE